MKETVHVRESLFDKASEIASEFKIKVIRPRVVVVEETANYCIDNPSDYWRMNIPTHCVLGSFSGRDIKANSKQRGAFFFCILSKP